jgi:hypothetical protein
VRTLAIVLFLTSSALARPLVGPKILGWTADGAHLLYEPPADDVGVGDNGGTGVVSYGVILDGRTGLDEKYLLGTDGEVPPEDRAKLDKLPKAAAWKKLVASAPLACAPPGEAAADVQLSGKGVKGSWKKDVYRFEFGGDPMAEEKAAAFTLSVKRGGKSWPSASWKAVQGNAAMGGALSGRVRACFAPGGRRVAWIAEREPGIMRDPGDWSILVGPAAGPRIQLVADRALLLQAAAKVGAALEAAGLASTASKVSNEKTARPATVVYAAAGFEAEAQKLAAAVPGGATVGKMDWKAPFDLVVGIGATAMK